VLPGDLDAVVATRYVTPLREGGSLPGLMEADDLGTYVVKFTGAGQGVRALVAEVICASLAAALGLPTPRLVTIELDPVLADNEPDEEVQALLRASPGTNLGVDFLPGALDLDVVAFPLDALFAGKVLWFDALIGNVDRSWRNPNMLYWHGDAYLIDHGAALTFHHRWPARPTARGYDPANHAVLGCAPDLDAADELLAPLVTAEVLQAAVAAVPAVWVAANERAEYVRELLARLAARTSWLPALHAAVRDYEQHGRPAPARNRPTWLGGS
jgi:hypothetical protein